MFNRNAVVAGAAMLLGLASEVPVSAQELTAEQARAFVVGRTFAYTCFDGSRGAGRIRSDGSVAGTVQMQGKGPMRRAALPANTVRVQGQKVCASLRGVPFEPCFNVRQTSDRSFRGSVSGFSFAYCDFVQGGRANGVFMRASVRNRGSKPLALRPSIAQ